MVSHTVVNPMGSRINNPINNPMVNSPINSHMDNPINNPTLSLTSNPTIRHIANPTTKRPTLQNRTIRGLQATRCLRSGEMTVRSKVLSRSVPLASCSALELI